MSNLIQQLQLVFNDTFDNCPIITENTTKADIEDWDSISNLSLILNLEDAFEKQFSVDEIERIVDVKSILTFIS